MGKIIHFRKRHLREYEKRSRDQPTKMQIEYPSSQSSLHSGDSSPGKDVTSADPLVPDVSPNMFIPSTEDQVQDSTINTIHKVESPDQNVTESSDFQGVHIETNNKDNPSPIQEYEKLSRDQPTKMQIEYPSSPSSLHSGDSSPGKDVTSADPLLPDVSPNMFIPSTENQAENSTINTIHKVESPDQNVTQSTDYQGIHIETNSEDNPSLFAPASLSCDHDSNEFIDIETISQQWGPFTPTMDSEILAKDAAAFIDAQNKLNQTIEANLRKQNRGMLCPKPSTLLLAKLNELRKKLPVKTEEETTISPATAIAQITDNLQGFIGIDSNLYKEKKQLVIRNESFVGTEEIEEPTKVKPEPTPYDDELPCTSSSVRFEVGGRRNVQPHPEAPLDAPINIENTPAQPVAPIWIGNVQTPPVSTNYAENVQTPPAIKAENVQADPEDIQHTPPVPTESTQFEHNPVFEEILEKTTQIFENFEILENSFNYFNEKGITIREADLLPTPPPTPTPNYVHVTADTTPEELTHLRAIPNNNSNNGQSNTRNFSAINRDLADTYPYVSPQDSNFIVIGPNGTVITKADWSKIDWDLSTPALTRKIMMGVFDRETMSTHTLTGRPSPAFKDLEKPEKQALDSGKVADIVHLITSHSNTTSKEIRIAITTKCADECKMRKWRGLRKSKRNNNNYENPPY